MITCPECGHRNQDSAQRCASCQASLASAIRDMQIPVSQPGGQEVAPEIGRPEVPTDTGELEGETPTGQSRLAYRLAAVLLLVSLLIFIVEMLLEPDLSQIISKVIDLGLAIGLLQFRRGARSWTLVRAVFSAILWPILAFAGNEPVVAAMMAVMQLGFSGSLILLLTGQSRTWRLVLAMGIYAVSFAIPYVVFLLIAVLVLM